MQKILPNEAYCSIYDSVADETKQMKRKGTDPVIVDFVSLDMKSKKKVRLTNYESFLFFVFFKSNISRIMMAGKHSI